MKTLCARGALVLTALLAAGAMAPVRAQQAAAPASRAAEVDALEPAVDVGPGGRGGGTGAVPAPRPAPAPVAASASAPLGRASAAAPTGRRRRAAAGEADTAAGARPSPVTASRAAASGRPKNGAVDRVDLGTTSITGNQELPKVLTIVPWKRSDLGEVVGRPANTLLDEVLAPVDPDVFKRHLEYYGELFDSKGQRSASPDAHD